MSNKVTTSIFLTLLLLEISQSVFQDVKSVKFINTVQNNELIEETVRGQNMLFSLTKKNYEVPNSTARRVKRNLPMGPRCAKNMGQYGDRCWPLDKYYEHSGVGEKLKDALKKENYEEEAINLMKKWRQKHYRCAKKPCGQSMKH
ncbi:hypothetical protein PYW07_004334 [Mythimna separata]|uniref:Uncharacterized protein n=1 Tax=Mythimna separata TaxID=271217 RepID=A0AAD8DXK5_MYTSE|nr:hypothetical protein PYW07_004334 [Mythimna separata]